MGIETSKFHSGIENSTFHSGIENSTFHSFHIYLVLKFKFNAMVSFINESYFQ